MDKKSEAAIRENALARPAGEREMEGRGSRLLPFLVHRMDDFTFVEFGPEYLKKSGLSQLMSGVPVPLRGEDEEAFRTEKGMGLNIIAENMAMVVGINPDFPHRESYKIFILKFLSKRPAGLLSKMAQAQAEDEKYEEACILYRAALVMDWDEPNAMYGYARVCRVLYNLSEEKERVGRFKAEAFDYLELLTELHPRFAQGWYYLGYMYLNMGLYTKAGITWENYLERSKDVSGKEEIKRRLDQIKIPIEIERGYTSVMSGRWQEGIAILEPFSDTVYRDWWPIWHYLGEAYLQAGRTEDAKEAFRSLLKLHGTHVETMESLIEIYREEGDEEMVKKYRGKIELITNT